MQLPDELSTLTALTVLHLNFPWRRSPSTGHWPLPLAAATLRFLSLSCAPMAAVHAEANASYKVHPLGQLTGAPIATLCALLHQITLHGGSVSD